MECSVRGAIGALAGVDGEDVFGFPRLELQLRQEEGRLGARAAEGPLLPVTAHVVLCEHLVDALSEEMVKSSMSSSPRAMGW